LPLLTGFDLLRLTSWTLIGLKDATQAQWEDYNLYIDPKVRAKSSRWLISKQTNEGSWAEHCNTLDREKFQVETLERAALPRAMSTIRSDI
jgi:hypothetical protein